jgi:hypothetical protein
MRLFTQADVFSWTLWLVVPVAPLNTPAKEPQ